MLPALRRLKVESSDFGSVLVPLSLCTDLRDLALEVSTARGESWWHVNADFSMLPQSLTHLSLTRIMASMSASTERKSVSPTELDFWWQYLLNLKVRLHLAHSPA